MLIISGWTTLSEGSQSYPHSLMAPFQDKLSTTWKNIEDESDLTDLTSEDDELDNEFEPSPPVQSRPTRQTAAPALNPVSASNRKSTRPSTREATQKSKARTGAGTSDKFPLPSHVMDNLKTTVINCVEYDGLSPEHEREMFQVSFPSLSVAKHSFTQMNPAASPIRCSSLPCRCVF